MPEFIRKFKFTPRNLVKIAIALFIVALLLVVSGFGGRSIQDIRGDSSGGGFSASMPGFMGGGMPGMGGGMYEYAEDSYYGYDGDSAYQAELSVRNVAPMASMPSPMYPSPGGTTGNTAEQFEVTEYSASIEARTKEKTCAALAELKSRDYVIFENANEYDRGCGYTFKVEHARVGEILAFVKELDPKEFSENSYTIKNQVDDFTSETEILEKKRDSIDETLENALGAYDEITRLASASQNADALAKVIDSKVQLIERLTQERINITAQLDRLARGKAEQLDRLEYTYFHVSVFENKYIDGERIKDSWKAAMAATVEEVNVVLQTVTLGLIALLFMAAEWILLILILVFLAKYVWRAVRWIWEK